MDLLFILKMQKFLITVVNPTCYSTNGGSLENKYLLNSPFNIQTKELSLFTNSDFLIPIIFATLCRRPMIF